jgi:hypothetical protein
VVAFVQYFLSISMFLNLPVRFAVREKYPLDRAHQREGPPTAEKLHSILSTAKPGDGLKKILIPHVGMYIDGYLCHTFHRQLLLQYWLV